MLHQTQNILVAPAELIGDLGPFIEQLGSPGGLAALADIVRPLSSRPIKNIADLKFFLRNYHDKILQPLELPAIQRAFFHASRNELRELIAFDRQLSGEPILQNFAGASQRVGQLQLQRLRPLRDHRFVVRYLAAVEQGEAHGWHTLVYGLTLAVYSLPLRQGLFGYADRTTRGFIEAAALSLSLFEDESQSLWEELRLTLPATVESLLGESVAKLKG